MRTQFSTADLAWLVKTFIPRPLSHSELEITNVKNSKFPKEKLLSTLRVVTFKIAHLLQSVYNQIDIKKRRAASLVAQHNLHHFETNKVFSRKLLILIGPVFKNRTARLTDPFRFVCLLNSVHQ